jgi:diguanylate cyclase (GGDEF)-like protein/PAS domain S-box-containing protein
MVRPIPHAALAVGDLLDILPDAVLMVDGGGVIVYVNPSMHALLGYEPSEILGQPLSRLVPQEARERHEAHVARYRREGAPMMMGTRPVLHALHRSGRVVPVSISLCNLAVGDPQAVSVAVLHDVSRLHTPLDHATARAETDLLTGLGNRVRLSRRLQACLASARPFGLLFMDLTGFKQVNDRLGHEVGDEVLRIVGQRLQSHLRQSDLLVRLGGDEFVMMLDGLDDPGPLRERALEAAALLAGPLRLDRPVAEPAPVLGANIGGALHPRHGRSERELLAAAGAAMYEAKRAGEPYRLAAR